MNARSMYAAAARKLAGDQLFRGPFAQSARTSRRNSSAVMAICAILIVAAPAANACTTFCSRGLFGRNYDWNIGYGMVTVNKRGMSKSSAVGGQAAKWVSRYGSVTFNQYGRDNPTGGMNEAGLVVELMWLDGTRYPAEDKRPQVGTLEWIQFQLDTASTVTEVIVNSKRVRILERGVPLHYLVADKNGDVATIEFLDGELVVHRGETLPVAALANDPYAESLAAMKNGASDRFARAAKGLAATTTVESAFALLDAVAQPSTQWSIVYDLKNRTVTWRTKANREPRSLSVRGLDYNCTTAVRVLDIDAGKGDVAASLREYSTDLNLALLRKSMRETEFLEDTPDAEIAAEARHPETSACVIARQ